MDDLCVALREIDLFLTISESSDDINIDWKHWKETFLSTVSKHIPKKKIRGRNPLPWINGDILHQIKKKDSIRRKLKANPTLHLQENTGKCVPKSNDYFAKAVRIFSPRSTTASQTTQNAFGQC